MARFRLAEIAGAFWLRAGDDDSCCALGRMASSAVPDSWMEQRLSRAVFSDPRGYFVSVDGHCQFVEVQRAGRDTLSRILQYEREIGERPYARLASAPARNVELRSGCFSYGHHAWLDRSPKCKGEQS